MGLGGTAAYLAPQGCGGGEQWERQKDGVRDLWCLEGGGSFSWGLSVLFSSYFVDGKQPRGRACGEFGTGSVYACMFLCICVCSNNIAIKMELVSD